MDITRDEQDRYAEIRKLLYLAHQKNVASLAHCLAAYVKYGDGDLVETLEEVIEVLVEENVRLRNSLFDCFSSKPAKFDSSEK